LSLICSGKFLRSCSAGGSSHCRAVVLIGLLIACNAFTGCNKKAFRRGDPFGGLAPVLEPQLADCDQTGKDPCMQTFKGESEPRHFSLAHIEFDDVGEMWSIGDLRPVAIPIAGKDFRKSQLEQAIDLIAENKQTAAKQKRPLLVLAFVHGWHNNASPGDEHDKNLGSFKASLQFLADREDCSGKCPIIVGVFLSWRGESQISLNGGNFLTYWSRRAAANRVGGPSMTEAVMRLAVAAKGAPLPFDETDHCKEQYPAPSIPATTLRENWDQLSSLKDSVFSAADLRTADAEASPQTTFLIVGHSFGGRVLEHAVAQPLLALLLERQAQANACASHWNAQNRLSKHPEKELVAVDVRSPIDLVALVNPANDAFEAKSLIEGFKRADLTDTDFKSPVIVSIKSDGDTATGWIMFAGQSVTQFELTMHAYDRGRVGSHEPSACEQGQLGLKTQGFYYKRSPAGIYNMRSHDVTELKIDEQTCDLIAQRSTRGRGYTWSGPTGHGSCSNTGGKPRLNKLDDNLCLDLNHGAPVGERYFWSFNPDKPACYKMESVSNILARDTNHDDPSARKYYSCQTGEMHLGPGMPAPAWSNTPYYVMGVPTSLIRDHNDIFQQGLFSMLMSLLEKRDPVQGTTITVKMPTARAK
jgi:hypothetical protein